jgi:hypothetical protein
MKELASQVGRPGRPLEEVFPDLVTTHNQPGIAA